MKRKSIVKAHILASVVAFLTISSFFTASLIAEINGNHELIRTVKKIILYSLPLMLISMPVLGITGAKLGGKSKNSMVVRKQKRMKLVFVNGLILISLVIFLYYRSQYQSIDDIFFSAQILELILGLTNLTLIGLNIKDGIALSGRYRPKRN